MLPALAQLESRRLVFAILTGPRAGPPVVPAALHARQHLATRDLSIIIVLLDHVRRD